MGAVTVIGSYNRDVSIAVDRLPRAGETRLGDSFFETHGGKGANQAAQAALCGAAVTLIAAIGDDEAGRSALAMWRDAAIATEHVFISRAEATGAAFIWVDAKGGNAIVVCPGANRELTPAFARRAIRAAPAPRIVLAQLETAFAAVREGFAAARSRGARTVLNAAPAPPRRQDIDLALVDVLIVNEIEAAALAGRQERAKPERAAGRLLDQVGGAVIVTLGAKGAMVLEKGEAPVFLPALAIDCVDSTGAGDAFCGAFAAALAEDRSCLDAARLGVVAGSLACLGRGAAASFAGAADLQRHLDLQASPE